MAEEKSLTDEEEKKKKELAEQAVIITPANNHFFESKSENNVEKQPANTPANTPVKNDNKDNKEDEEKVKVPELPKADFSVSNKYIKLSKNFETVSYWSKIMPWIFIPLAIGAAMTGLGILSLVFVAIATFSIVMIHAGGELKDAFEDLAIKEEKSVVEANKSNLQEYYKQCKELNIEPLSPNVELKDSEKTKITAAQQRALDQTCQQQAAQATKQSQQAEQSK